MFAMRSHYFCAWCAVASLGWLPRMAVCDRFLPAEVAPIYLGGRRWGGGVRNLLPAQLSARLVATKFEFQIDGSDNRGPKGGSRRSAQTILTAKVYRLEYQQHESGGQGIYAVTAFGEPQVLPFVDGAQADEIMAAIKTKFPGLAEMWKRSEDAATKGRG